MFYQLKIFNLKNPLTCKKKNTTIANVAIPLVLDLVKYTKIFSK